MNSLDCRSCDRIDDRVVAVVATAVVDCSECPDDDDVVVVVRAAVVVVVGVGVVVVAMAVADFVDAVSSDCGYNCAVAVVDVVDAIAAQSCPL